jgi:hypothetical protein
LIVATARVAFAAPPERTFYVEYIAEGGCPDQARFVEALLARASGAESVDEARAAIRFRVELQEGASALGVEVEEGRSRREFSGGSCQDRMETMALVAAMVIEAEPGSRLSASDGVVSQPPAATVPAPASSRAPVAAAPVVTQPPAPRASEARPIEQAAAAPAARWALALTAGLTLESAVASSPPLGGVIGVDLSWRREQRWGWGGRLEALATLPATEQASVGAAELRLAAARASACTLRAFGAFVLVPCLSLDVGVLWATGTGEQVQNATEATMPWIAPGLTVRAEHWLAGSVALDAALGARLLTRYDEFYLRPGSTAYQVPRGSFGGQIGLKFAIF